MNYANLILGLLAGIGLSQILSSGTIMMPLKQWLGEKNKWWSNLILNVLVCHQCNGLYAGLFVYLLLLLAPWFNFVLWALAVSFGAHTFAKMTAVKEN